MHGCRIWALLALTGLFCSGSHGGEELPCDDKSVGDVVASALSAHNKELTEGAQLALYQIIEATKAQNESAQIVSVNFTARESDCAAGSEKPWNECDYMQDPLKELRHCRAEALVTDTVEISSHTCSVEPSIVPEPRPPCLGCPEKIDVESEDITESLSYSVLKANDVNEHTHHFLLNNIAWATRQVIAGFRYKLQFDMQKSNCSKAEFKELTEECHPDPDETTFINCNSTVDVAPWRHELPDTNVHCSPGPLLMKFNIRRRPPGWSPLRNIHNFAVQKPKREESSEESQEGKSTPATLTEAANTTAATAPQPPAPHDTPPEVPGASTSRCPGKPWKEFRPPPPPPRPPPPPPRPPVDQPVRGGFTDADLLALV